MSASGLGAGDKLGKWYIDQALAPGPSPTFIAHHVDDKKKIAQIKVLAKGTNAMALAKREVRILKSLEHPTIPKFLDFGYSQAENAVWIATEYFHGSTLAELVRAEPPDWQATCRIFQQLAQGLTEIHGNGIVHQSISADHVLVGPGDRVQFTDLSEAIEANELERASAPTEFGPLATAAPELAKQPRSARSDLYALGVMLQETLTRKPAFPLMITADRQAALRFLDFKRKEAAPLDPGADLPTWLRNIVRKATEPDPERRLPDAETLLMFFDATQASWAKASEASTIPEGVLGSLPPPATAMRSSSRQVTEPIKEAPGGPPPLAPLAPQIMMVRPSIAAPAVPVLVPANSPMLQTPETPLVPIAYATAGTLGVITGIAAGVLLIGAIDAAYVYIP